MDPMDDEYLWDRTGPPDEDVAHLEALLARFAAPPAEAWAPLALDGAADRGRRSEG